MSGKRLGASQAAHLLEPGERVVVELNGVVAGFTRWSGLGGIIGIVTALTVPRLLELSFLLGAVSIVVVLGLFFVAIYFGVGRPLGKRNEPPLTGPYLTLALTDRRVLLLDRALGAEEAKLAESIELRSVSTVRHGRAGALVPQRLGYVVDGVGRREYEFPRSEPVSRFVETFSS